MFFLCHVTGRDVPNLFQVHIDAPIKIHKYYGRRCAGRRAGAGARARRAQARFNGGLTEASCVDVLRRVCTRSLRLSKRTRAAQEPLPRCAFP